jgi:cation transport ATPase
VTIASGSLEQVVTLRRIAEALMDRINGNYRFIISFNGLLIALGALGALRPATSALLHNGSTVITGLKSMTELLPE